MSLRLHNICVSALAILYTGIAEAGTFSITNSSVENGTLCLSWSSPTNRNIVCSSTNLLQGFSYTGQVLPGNATNLPIIESVAYFRVLAVYPVVFLDPVFEQQVKNTITNKFYPTNEVYDIDLESIENFSAESAGITNMSGLQNFTGLRFLNVPFNGIEGMDLSSLSQLAILYCDNNGLTNLDVTHNYLLSNLNCEGNYLTQLDVSSNRSLVYLACSYNSLTALDLSYNPFLEDLYCAANSLVSLNLSAASNLCELSCNDNQLGSLQLSEKDGLRNLQSQNNKLTSLDLTGCVALESLMCNNNLLTTLNLSACTNADSLDCSSNLLTVLDISANTNLTYVNARWNPLGQIFVWWDPTGAPPITLVYDGSPGITNHP